VGEHDRPAIADPLVEIDLAVGGVCFEIRGSVVYSQGHKFPPPLHRRANVSITAMKVGVDSALFKALLTKF
jgi:hypothetical protein